MAGNGWTPGPWLAAPSHGGQVKICGPWMARGGTHRRVAMVGSPRSYTNVELDTEIEANARLIAAAPDLYEALEAIDTFLRSGEGDGAALQVKAADALAKARGAA